jgi:hypothetical protein
MANPGAGDPDLNRDKDEAFTVLVLRYLDGHTTADDVAQLNRSLTSQAQARELFVHLCRLHGELSEALAPQRALRVQAKRSAKATSAAALKQKTVGTAAGIGAEPTTHEQSESVSVALQPGESQSAPLPGEETPEEKLGTGDTIMTDHTPDDTVHVPKSAKEEQAPP